MVKKRKDDIIQDTSAPPMICDVNAKDEEEGSVLVPTEGRLKSPTHNTVTVYFRMDADVQEHFKQIAREIAYKEGKDITYQQVMVEAALQVHPMGKE